MPDSGFVQIEDVVRGTVTFQHEYLEDFVVLKGDGQPLFVLANTVDDIDMGITHVIRGEDLLPSVPKGILIWQALDGGKLPCFAHLPMLVDAKRRKLSKRRDPVSLVEYQRQGYIPTAFCNYLALLGWNPEGGRQGREQQQATHQGDIPGTVSLNEMVKVFCLEDVNSSPAFFDVKKLTHINAVYIRSMTTEQFILETYPFLESEFGPGEFDKTVFRRLAPSVQSRVSTLSEVAPMVAFALLNKVELADSLIDETSWKKTVIDDPKAIEILRAVFDTYSRCDWMEQVIKEKTLNIAVKLQLKLAKAQAPIRVAVTGNVVGLPLFESLEVIGREKTLARIKHAIDVIDEVQHS